MLARAGQVSDAETRETKQGVTHFHAQRMTQRKRAFEVPAASLQWVVVRKGVYVAERFEQAEKQDPEIVAVPFRLFDGAAQQARQAAPFPQME